MGKFCHMPTSRSSSKNIEKINNCRLSNIELVLTHSLLELGVLGITGKLLEPFVTSYKKNSKKI